MSSLNIKQSGQRVVIANKSEDYILPIASTIDLGGIKVGANLSIDANGVLSAVDITSVIDDANAANNKTYSSNKILQLISAIKSFEVEIVETLPEVGEPHKIYFVPKEDETEKNIYDEFIYINNKWEKIGSTDIKISVATTEKAGIVKPDGESVTVDTDGTIHASAYALPIASDTRLGGVKVGNNLSIDSSTGVLSADKDEYSVVESSTPASGCIKSYSLTKNGQSIGANINVPKDWVLTDVEIKTSEEDDLPEAGYVVGDKYIDYTLNTKDKSETATHIFLKINDLYDNYIGGSGISIINKTISIKLNSTGGLKFDGSSSDELAIDFETTNIDFDNY